MGLEACAVCGAWVPEVPSRWKLITTGDLEPRAVLCPSCARDAAAIVETMRNVVRGDDEVD